MAVLRLLKAYGSNVLGEVAGFPDDVAATLVASGVAVRLEAPKPEVVVTRLVPAMQAAPVEVVEKQEVADKTTKAKKKR
jgi:hypothetical protein